MDFLGIGPLELFFIVLIALIVLGPQDMVKAGRTLGRWMRSLVMSETWRTLTQASKEIRTLPTRLMREAGIDEIKNQLPEAETIRKELDLSELKKDLSQEMQADISDWTTPPPLDSQGEDKPLAAEEAEGASIDAWTNPPSGPAPAKISPAGQIETPQEGETPPAPPHTNAPYSIKTPAEVQQEMSPSQEAPSPESHTPHNTPTESADSPAKPAAENPNKNSDD